jgi:MoxR-like ATPase
MAIGYPCSSEEAAVLREDPAATELPLLEPVVSLPELRGMQQAASHVKLEDSIVGYLLALVQATREHEALELGVSPRGAVALRRAAQARALVEGRDYCIPEDVRDLAIDVFAHRVLIDARGGARRSGSGDTAWILREILDRAPVPV